MDEDDRYCASCTYLVGRRTYQDTAEDWRCHHPENVVTSSRDLVTGSTVYHLRFASCYDARSDDTGCGSAGKWYQLYKPYVPKVVAGQRYTADQLLDELDNIGSKK